MRIVIAVGGNALLKRNEPLTFSNQLNHVKCAAAQLVKLATENQLVITHGNGPQIGLLALQNETYDAASAYPLDVLGAQTQGMIGYLLQQEMTNLLPRHKQIATLLTRVEVDAKDAAFAHPTKPIGSLYSQQDAEKLAKERHWVIAADGNGYRRVVASPKPQRIVEIEPILTLLEQGMIVVAVGGGGIPVVVSSDGNTRKGIEAVIDKDIASALLAQQINAEILLIATDVDAVYLDWGKPTQRAIQKISPTLLRDIHFPAGSMGPKVSAACQFAEATHRPVYIGALDKVSDMLKGKTGTCVTVDCEEIHCY